MSLHKRSEPVYARHAFLRGLAALLVIVVPETDLIFPPRQFAPVDSEDAAVGDDLREVDRRFRPAGFDAGAAFFGGVYPSTRAPKIAAASDQLSRKGAAWQ